MISETLRQHYQDKLRQRLNDLADTVSTGGAKSFEEYHRLVGRIEGVAFAERDFLDLVEAADKAQNKPGEVMADVK